MPVGWERRKLVDLPRRDGQIDREREREKGRQRQRDREQCETKKK